MSFHNIVFPCYHLPPAHLFELPYSRHRSVSYCPATKQIMDLVVAHNVAMRHTSEMSSARQPLILLTYSRYSCPCSLLLIYLTWVTALMAYHLLRLLCNKRIKIYSCSSLLFLIYVYLSSEK